MQQMIRTTPRIHPLVAAAAASVIVVSAAGVGVMTGVLPGTHATAPPTTAVTAAPAAMLAPPAAVAAPVAAAPASTIIAQAAPVAQARPTVTKPRVVKVASVDRDADYEAEAPARRRATLPAVNKTQRTGDPYEPNPYGNPGNGGVYGGAQGGGTGGFGNVPVLVTQAPVAKPVCANCGVVEAVVETQKAGEGSGVGIAGGALGGAVIGKQFGKGRGADALAILGAIGGAVAGHQIEKSVRSTKVYEVHVRMEDGSTRSLTQTSAPAWRNGDRVKVEGNSISINYS